MTRPVTPNTTALRSALRKLRKQDRLDEVGQALGVLLVTSAKLVDEATGPYSDVAGYARARIVQTHGGLLKQMDEHLAPTVGSSAADDFLRSLMVPTLSSWPPDDDDRM
jgi:hypothetical protein